ncbi:MAG: ATP synthase F0 subunit B [Bdellovibrionaceae bacterium]|jgi:F-type H+-transporting ATPase subunit b|nr:ATP synthase F0 subunit B [Pseudobdellovibrionaceae bacterium]
MSQIFNYKFKQIIIAIGILLYGASLFAAGSNHGEVVEIPGRYIFQQIFNFALAVFILWYFLRKAIRAHFKNRHQQYHEIVNQVESAKIKAEDMKKTLQEKMLRLSDEAEKNAHNAKAEAEEMHHKLMSEASGLSEKLIKEAQATIEIELVKAKQHLKADLLEASILKAQEELKATMSDEDQKRLKTEFVEKIQGVH